MKVYQYDFIWVLLVLVPIDDVDCNAEVTVLKVV